VSRGEQACAAWRARCKDAMVSRNGALRREGVLCVARYVERARKRPQMCQMAARDGGAQYAQDTSTAGGWCSVCQPPYALLAYAHASQCYMR